METREMKLQVEYIPLNEIKLYPNNAKIHTSEQIEQIKKSIKEFGFNDPIGIWHGECVEGHGRIIAATELGLETVPVIRLDELTDEQRKAYMLVHNKLTMNTDFDMDLLDLELDNIVDIDMSEYGFDIDTMEYLDTEDRTGNMAKKYFVPPFSVIYANKPDWLARKRKWVKMGLHSEIGRGGDLLLIQGAIQRQTSYQGGRTEQSLQKQYTPQQLKKQGVPRRFNHANEKL